MRPLATVDFEALVAEATLVEHDKFGPKVYLREDGTYVKLFRRKRLLSSALWYPYAARFVDNAGALRVLGIEAPAVIASYRVAALARDVVHYTPVPGETLRSLFRQNPDTSVVKTLRWQLAGFICTLFDKGIYFRSLHLGNVVHLPNGSLGLIDVSDLRRYGRALSPALRIRNVERMKRLCKPGELAWFDLDTIMSPPTPKRSS